MNNQAIESAATALLRQIWASRRSFWPEGRPSAFAALDPSVAALVLDLRLEYAEQLGRFGTGDDRFEVAGTIDRRRKLIAVSKRFRPEVQRFTAAHELGHWCLHPRQVMHRDRPVGGVTVSPRSQDEREADYFAACFLVPRKLLIEQFASRFSDSGPLALNDESAFWLSKNDPDSLLESDRSQMRFELAVATAPSYAGRRFDSLANQFGVSATTMAIRLRELGLVAT